MTNEDQLTLLQIGAFIGRYLPEYTLPKTMGEAAEIIHNNLNLNIKRGDSFDMIRNKIITAIKEHDELMLLGEEFYNMYTRVSIEDEIAASWANQFSEAIDREILDQLVVEVEEEKKITSFDEAMKGI